MTSALDLAIAFREGKVTSSELVERSLARIEERNGELGAFVRWWPEKARREAARADRAREAGRVSGVFAGVPTGIKDTDPVAGAVTDAGSRAFRWGWTPFDGAIARRVRKGGFVVVGKLATSELALLPVIETDLHPPCRNPHASDRTSGGSSGGSAAAVASGMLPVAPGADGGGSIRIPAAFCGLFGHKPSRGLLPHFYERVDPIGFSTAGALASTVDDSAAVLDVLMGRDYDPRNPPQDSLLARCREPVPHLRVRLVLRTPVAETDPEHQDAARRVAAALAQLGHQVEEGEIVQGNPDEFLPLYGRVFTAVPILRESLLQPPTRYLRGVGRTITGAEARTRAALLARRLDEWFGDTDLVVTPTTAIPPPQVGAWKDLDGPETLRAATPLGAYTAMFNVGGQPAASIPAGRTNDGLPIGVQIAGRAGQDARVMAVCRTLMRQPLDSPLTRAC